MGGGIVGRWHGRVDRSTVVLRQREGEADVEGAEGGEAVVREAWSNGGVEDKVGDTIGPTRRCRRSRGGWWHPCGQGT